MDPTNDKTKFRGGAPRESNQPIRFAGSVHGAQRHVCAFFHNPDEGVSGATFVHKGEIQARTDGLSYRRSQVPGGTSTAAGVVPASMWPQRNRERHFERHARVDAYLQGRVLCVTG
jgi:hypothetical protein